MGRTLLKFSLSFAAGWVLGWLSWFILAAFVAYREFDQ